MARAITAEVLHILAAHRERTDGALCREVVYHIVAIVKGHTKHLHIIQYVADCFNYSDYQFHLVVGRIWVCYLIMK